MFYMFILCGVISVTTVLLYGYENAIRPSEEQCWKLFGSEIYQYVDN